VLKQREHRLGMGHLVMGGFVLKRDDGAPPLRRQGHLGQSIVIITSNVLLSKMQAGTASGSCRAP
jgi:hypothetical protein